MPGAADDDPPHHAGVLMWHAEEVVHALDGQGHREGLVRQQVIRGPRFGSPRDAQWAVEVLGVVGRCRMRVAGVKVDPVDRLARLNVDPDRVEPDVRSVGVALHQDLHRSFARKGRTGNCETGEETPAELESVSAGHHHFEAATRVSSAFGTCHRMTWAWGFSTPGWPALK